MANREINPMTRIAKPRTGSHSSKARLQELRFDPIYELVKKFRQLEGELEYHEKWRNNEIVVLTSTGKTRNYNVEVHMNLYDKLTSISEKLLRYHYGRVSEVDTGNAIERAALVINLSTTGDTYTIGDTEDEFDDNLVNAEY
jgi:hypothetical protein